MLRGMRYGPGSPRPRSRPLVPPGHRPAGHVCQDRLGRHRDLIRDVTLARSSAPRNGGDHRHVGWIDLAAFRDPDSPGQATRAQGLSERGGPITRFGQHAAEAHAPPFRTRSISATAISSLVRASRRSLGTPALLIRCGSLVQVSGRNSARPTATGTSPRASVSDTNV